MKNKNILFLTSIGISLEYYDFVVYGLLAIYLSHLFFPATNQTAALIQALSLFAVGYVARPFGGVIFGALGDRFGRKYVFLLAMLIMAFSTMLIGVLPTYNEVGLIATLLLLTMRILQGLAYGAELPGAITFLTEYAHKNSRGTQCGIMMASVSVGASFASGLVYALTSFISTEQMSTWGWRIPFLFGGTLAIVGYIARKKLHETPMFSIMQKHSHVISPILQLIQQERKQMIYGTSLVLLAACLVIFAISLPAFLQTFYHYKESNIYLTNTISLLWSMLILPLCGMISDRINRQRLFIITVSSFILLAFVFFELLNYEYNILLLSFMLIYQTFLSFLVVTYIPLLAEIFPTRIRFTGIGFCYNIAYCIAGFCPSLITYFTQKINSVKAAPLFFISIALIAVLCVAGIKVKVREELHH